MKFRDKPIQERIDYLRQRHGKQLRVVFIEYGLCNQLVPEIEYGPGQGLWAEWGGMNCNLTEFPGGVVAVTDEKALESTTC